MISRLKIKHKFLAISTLTILAVLLVAGVLGALENLKSHREYFSKRIQGEAAFVAGSIGAAVLFDDWEEARNILYALESDSAVLKASVIDPDNETRVTVSFRDAPPMPSIDPYAFTGHTQHEGLITAPVMHANKEIATLEILYHEKELHEAIQQSVLSILFEVLVALVVGVLMFMAMQSSIFQPIANLSALTKHITQSKNYSLRGDIVYPDEIGSLTQDFNLMLDIVEQGNQRLEEMVQERTKQLEYRNLELAIQISEREKSEKARREVEEKFRQAFINAPIGMALISTQRKIWQPNLVLQQILGENSQESLSMDSLISSDYSEKVREQFDSLLAGKIDKFECDVKCFDTLGRELYAILSLSAVRNEIGLFQYAVLQLRDVTESKKLSKKLEYQATHDDLTGLPNRRVLQNLFEQEVAGDRDDAHVLCVLDLDQFKVVNDNCGHAGGDELLCQVARLLQDQVRSQDLVVRLGGDEFAVLLYHCDIESAEKITDAIKESISQLEFIWQGQTYRLSASIGAITVKNTQEDISALMQQADAACYIAKDMGRNRVYIIDSDYDQGISERQTQMRWVQRLHEALENQDFVLYAQPIVPLQRAESECRMEILLRMRDKNTGGLILPGAFITAAERYGLSSKIDSWVVSSLIQTLKENPKLAEEGTNYWVNLSGLSLGDENFLRTLETQLEESNLPRGLINFEITETAMIQNISKLSPSMGRLQELGCKFALDDFGSGTSSFGYLKKLPVEYLKIDGMFVRNILQDKIDLIFVKSIIDIAKVMGIEVVSEFVESEEIGQKLKEIGADYGQGYALGKPVPLLLEVTAGYPQAKEELACQGSVPKISEPRTGKRRTDKVGTEGGGTLH